MGDRQALAVPQECDIAEAKAELTWTWLQRQAQRNQDPNTHISPWIPLQHT